MTSLKTTMDAAFWNLNISTPQTIDGVARSIPGEPVPLDVSRASKINRVQQFTLLKKRLPLGLVPGFQHPPFNEEFGGAFLQRSLALFSSDKWWLGLIGQLRPMKIIRAFKADIPSPPPTWESSPIIIATDFVSHYAMNYRDHFVNHTMKQIFDKSNFTGIGLCSRLALAKGTYVQLSTEKHAEKKKLRTKASLYHMLDKHDVTLEAAWPELFIDHNGKYWNVPESISLDCLSIADTALRYRFGIHKNGGYPEAADTLNGSAPLSLMPGLCAKAAFSYEKSRYRKIEWKNSADDVIEMSPAYELGLSEPHAAISGIIGGTCEAWWGPKENLVASTDHNNNTSMGVKRRSPFSVDTFGSVSATLQLGGFRKKHGDLTRVDARLDIPTSLRKNIFSLFGNSGNLQTSPRLNLIFQQQVSGPLLFRIDSRFSIGSSGKTQGPHVEEVVCSLNRSIRYLKSAKVSAWYSLKRKEGMVELRFFEF